MWRQFPLLRPQYKQPSWQSTRVQRRKDSKRRHTEDFASILLPKERCNLLAPRSSLACKRGSPIATARRLAFDEEDSALGIVVRFLEGILNGVGWGHSILQAGFHPRISHLSTPLGELVPNEHGEHGHWFQMNMVNMDIGAK